MDYYLAAMDDDDNIVLKLATFTNFKLATKEAKSLSSDLNFFVAKFESEEQAKKIAQVAIYCCVTNEILECYDTEWFQI